MPWEDFTASVTEAQKLDESRQRPLSAGGRADGVHHAALGETDARRCRHRPVLLRTVRLVGAEKRAAIGRCLGSGFTPVQGLRRVPGAGRKFGALKQASELPLAVAADVDQFLQSRLLLLEQPIPGASSTPTSPTKTRLSAPRW